MGLYPPLETGDNYRLQHVAEVRFRLENKRDYTASLYKKNRRRANVVDGRHRAFGGQRGLAAFGVGLLSTIIAVPVAIGIQAGAIVCGLLGAGGKFIGRRLQAKARKHDQIRVLAESKLNTIADRISTALTDDKISDEEFRLILDEVNKYNQMRFVGVRNRVCTRKKKRSYYGLRETKR